MTQAKRLSAKSKGGSRPNAGRKPKYKEATTTVAFRVPVSMVAPLKATVAAMLSQSRLPVEPPDAVLAT